MGSLAPATPEASLLKQLKEETSACHRAVEAELDLAAQLTSRSAWCAVLEILYGFFEPLENRVFAQRGLAAWLPDLNLRKKTERLRIDIETLGGNVTQIRRCEDVPRPDSLGEAFGALYVMEGATLGGQVISRMAALHGYTPERGCCYFTSYGGQVGPMWRIYCSQCEAFGARHPDARESMVAAAVETFTFLRAWIGRR